MLEIEAVKMEEFEGAVVLFLNVFSLRMSVLCT